MRDVTFVDRGTRLAGTVHAGAGPAVVLATGSGPSDRAALDDWVRGLHGAGLTVLVYDKPGCGESGGDWRTQTLDDRAAETIAAARFLRAQPEAEDRTLSIVGGSQGGWVALLVAGAPEVDAVVCVSAAAVTVADQELFRVEHQLPALGFAPADVEAALALLRCRVERIARGDEVEAIFAGEQAHVGARWMEVVGDTTLEELVFDARVYAFDPADAIRSIGCPLLAMWGGADVIVPVERSVARMLELLPPNADIRTQLVVIPNADHGIRLADGRRAPGLWPTIAAWLARVG